jgi:IS605 OrfB family transposase
MKEYASYRAKIKHYNHIFKDTVAIYRKAVDFLIDVCSLEWDSISQIDGELNRKRYIETLIHRTKGNLSPRYDFDECFYKMPTYLRRAAISETIGKISSYKSNLANWSALDVSIRGKEPGYPKAGNVFPVMYREGMYVQTGEYTAKIKVYTHNTWDWITVDLRKSDMDYIAHHCSDRKQCAPTLRKRGKQWFLEFPFEETVLLNDTDIKEQIIIAVDLGINTPATVSVMCSDGTIPGRHFCKLSRETDSLTHSVNRIKKSQQNRNHKTPRLWARAKGISHDISVKTADFIMQTAVRYNADVIVFEHLDTSGKKRGSKKQKLSLWRKQEVQSIVTNKAHRLGMRVSRINAWGTSRLAYDGSGRVLRGMESDRVMGKYGLCEFSNGKIYNCDLSASYNIGARYFIREILKSLSERARLLIEAKVPHCSKRSTCTLSDLLSLNAVLPFI